jgi:membrane-associated phospholipid phosphatase
MDSRALSRVLALGVVFVMLAKGWSQDSHSKAVTGSEVSDGTGLTAAAKAHVPATPYMPVEDTGRPGFSGHIADFVEDQKRIWTSPLKIRLSDANWLVPLGGITAGLFVTDREYSASINQNPTTLKHYKSLSNYTVAGLIGGSAGLYLFSFPTHNERWRETGFLAGEAALNSLVTVEALKYSLQRERPYQGDGSGSFFHGGTSFPSEHAAAAWSIAGVLAHEYPGTLPKILAYGAASAVSFSRIKAHQHFPSDVVVGSVLGYLIAQNVYRHRHNPEIGGAAWESPREFVSDEKSRTPAFMGSPYVPLDSWIYPALERLAALGYIKTISLGMRPWTRLECARLLNEAGEREADTNAPSEVQQLYSALSQEFAHDYDLMSGESNRGAQLESVYFRTLAVSGQPLTDNYHFGQTILNDYGRPYQEGFNSVAGVSGWTTVGPFVIYTRGEYQSAPSAPSLPPAALDFIANVDGLPPSPPTMPYAGVNRFRLLDAYIGMNLAKWQISFGRQSLWWGPGDEGAMLFTNNAEPLNKMFRIDRVSPFRLPGPLRYLGDIRMEFFLGQVSGHQFINNGQGEGILNSGLIGQYGKDLALQPFVSGGKIDFKFNSNLEISVSKTTLYGGPGNPLTLGTWAKSVLGTHHGNSPSGDGRSGFDLTYRIPKLRDWATFYVDSFQEDEISPLNRPYKAAFQSGMYFAKLPKVPKLDLRIEGGTTSPINFPTCIYCYYSNNQYLNGYTNNGQLMGTWLGRAAQGESLKSTYWLSAQRKVTLELRHRKIDRQYLPQGGTQNDAGLSADFFVKSGVRLSGTAQYERWQIPLLASSTQSNWTASVQIGYWPSPTRR